MLRELLVTYLFCWAAFIGIAAYVASRGGVVSMFTAAIAPIAPLRQLPNVLSERGAFAALAYAAWSIVPLVLGAVAVANPAKQSWRVAARAGIAAQWLLFLAAMGTGS